MDDQKAVDSFPAAELFAGGGGQRAFRAADPRGHEKL